MIAEELDRAASVALVLAELDSPALAGFAVAWRVADETQLLYIAVRAALRRQGLASSLLSAVLAECGSGRTLLEVRTGFVCSCADSRANLF